jgi:hypothetical protein
MVVSEPAARLAIADQSSIVDTSRAGWWSIGALRPVGQTFKPSFGGVDGLELWIEDQWNTECSGVNAGLQVNLREKMIDGLLIGSSSPIVLPTCYKGIVLFSFPSLIAVSPDKVYAIEVVAASHHNWGVVWQQEPESYPRGQAVALGATGDADLWFQAGLRSPTPLTEAYCQNDLWQHVMQADGRAFLDQADCARYAAARQ